MSCEIYIPPEAMERTLLQAVPVSDALIKSAKDSITLFAGVVAISLVGLVAALVTSGAPYISFCTSMVVLNTLWLALRIRDLRKEIVFRRQVFYCLLQVRLRDRHAQAWEAYRAAARAMRR